MAPKKSTKAAGSKPKAAKTTTKAKAAAPAAAEAVPGHNSGKYDLDVENQKLFVGHHLPNIKTLRDKVATATANLRNGYKTAKAEGGFTKADFDTAIQIEDAEKEAKAKARIARQMVIARYMGKALGNQLELFLEPDRTPSSDIAFEEGKQDHLANKPAKPGYDPSTEQHRKYMEGYHSVTETRVTEGIKPLSPKKQKEAAIAEDEAAKAAEAAKINGQKEADAEAFDGPPPALQTQTSGVPTSRAQFLAAQERERAEGSAFSKKN